MATKLKTVEDAVNDRLGEEDKLRIWNRVCKTDPAHTKKVNQRGGFTAISAHYQVLSATAEFGPVGIGWGYTNGEPVFHETLVIVPVTIWHGNRSNTFGPLYGAAEWKSGNRIDSDAAKKASTDGLTKGLSQLGFNADVFLGKFDDNKYVAQLAQEFAETGSDAPAGDGKISTAQRDELLGLTDKAGVTVEQFCGVYKISAVADLPPSLFDRAKASLQRRIPEPA